MDLADSIYIDFELMKLLLTQGDDFMNSRSVHEVN